MKTLQLLTALFLVISTARAQPLTQAWAAFYNGLISGDDEAKAMALDRNGNVFVTGQSLGSGGLDYDVATVAYSNDGVPLWTNRYNGPGNSWDAGNAVAVDGHGDVVVTGFSVGSGSYYDYVTLKYSAAGIPLWTNRYNGPGNAADFAPAVAVDFQNNIFVAGYSTGSGGNYDYATIKYSSAGAPLWTNRYNGPGNSDDAVANAIAVDTNGSVFVAGHSLGLGSGYDYATIAYSNNGAAAWTNRYNGPGNGEDDATALAVDAAGNVFVTGYSTNNGAGFDYATIAYSNSGIPLWTNRYHYPGSVDCRSVAIVLDRAGMVFVTGTASMPSAYGDVLATLAYSHDGTPLWTNTLPGPGAEGMALDSAGRVFVSAWIPLYYGGGAYYTVGYTSDGLLFWTARSSMQGMPTAIASDQNGNVFVTGYGGDEPAWDYVTIKYTPLKPIPVMAQWADNQMVLSWTNSDFLLQEALNASGPFSTLDLATSPFTNSITRSSEFFRLISR